MLGSAWATMGGGRTTIIHWGSLLMRLATLTEVWSTHAKAFWNIVIDPVAGPVETYRMKLARILGTKWSICRSTNTSGGIWRIV